MCLPSYVTLPASVCPFVCSFSLCAAIPFVPALHRAQTGLEQMNTFVKEWSKMVPRILRSPIEADAVLDNANIALADLRTAVREAVAAKHAKRYATLFHRAHALRASACHSVNFECIMFCSCAVTKFLSSRGTSLAASGAAA